MGISVFGKGFSYMLSCSQAKDGQVNQLWLVRKLITLCCVGYDACFGHCGIETLDETEN
jgi:hypothetical protein